MTNHPRDVKLCPYHEIELRRDDEGGSVLEWCDACDQEARDLFLESVTKDD